MKKEIWIIIDILMIIWGIISIFINNTWGILIGAFGTYSLIKEL